MSLSHDLARSIVKKNEGKLKGLSDDERAQVVSNIVTKFESMPQDEQIQYLSARHRDLTPELEADLARTEAQKAKLFSEEQRMSEITGRPPRTDLTQLGYPGQELASRISRLKKEKKAQEIGIETRLELPTGSLELGFGDDPEKALTNVLSDHFGKSVTVFKRDGEFNYVDPEDGIIKRANPTAAGKLGIGLPIIGDIGGTIGGYLLFKPVSPAGAVAAETAGSTVGTGVGEFLRLMTGRIMGVHDMSWEEILKKSSVEGVKAGAMTGAVGTVMTSYKGLKNVIGSGNFTKRALLKEGFTSKQSDAILDEVNRILGRKGAVKGTLANRIDNDVVLRSKEREVRESINFSQKFAERDLSDQRALTEALEKLTKTGETGGGKAVSEALSAKVSKRIEQAKSIVFKNVDDLKAQLNQIGKVSKREAGEPIRQVLQAKRDIVKKAQDDAWENVKKIGGYKPETKTYGIPVPEGKELKNLKNVAARKAKTARTKLEQSQQLFVKGKRPAQDLADFNSELSTIRSEMRTALKNKQSGTPEYNRLKEIRDAMIEDRRKALIQSGRKDLLDEIEKAEDLTRAYKAEFDKNIVGDLLAKNDAGISKIKSKEFVDRLLKSDKEEFGQLLDSLADNPEAQQLLKEGIADAYKRAAYKDLKFNKQASEKFFSDYGDILNQQFTKSELAGFRATGDLADKVAKQTAQLNKIKTGSAKVGKGKLESLDPDSMVKWVTEGSGKLKMPVGKEIQETVNKVKYLKGVLKNDPEAYNKFADEYMDKMGQRMLERGAKVTGKEGQEYIIKDAIIDPRKMNEWIADQADVIKALKGEQYLKDLQSVNAAVQLLAKKMQRLTGDEGIEAIKQGIRAAIAPPLTREGRVFTGITKLLDKYRHANLSDAFLDADNLHKLGKLAEHNVTKRESAEIAASLGIILED